MRDFPIDITVTYDDKGLYPCFKLRGETSFHGERVQAIEEIDKYMGHQVFDYDRLSKRVFVRDEQFFAHMVERTKHRIMDHISGAYRPRIALGG